MIRMSFTLQLQERMDAWTKDYEINKCDTPQKIGDLFKTLGPFLKMYTEYMKDFTKATDCIDEHYANNPKFKAVMDEIHVRLKYLTIVTRQLRMLRM